MSRLPVLLALAALLIPGIASAAVLGELTPTPLAGTGSCLTATGVPAELVRDAGGPVARLDVLHVRPGGFSAVDTAAIGGEDFACAAVAARPDGEAIAAGTDPDVEGGARILVATRAAGGAFGAPAVIASPRVGYVDRVVAALSARGDAVVAWQETHGSRTRLRAVLRPAGGVFGAPVAVASGRALDWLTAGMSAGGDAILAWATSRIGYQLPQITRVHARIAPAGGAFGASRVVAEAPDGRAPVLAVGDDGRALLALPAPGALRVAERPPGGTFGAPVTIARVRGDDAPHAAVALGGGGRAAIVWTTLGNAGAWLVTRDRAGAFGRVTELARPRTPRPAGAADVVFLNSGGGDVGLRGFGEESRVAATLTPGGVLAAWLAPRHVAGAATTGVRTAFVPAAGGPTQRSLLGGGLRDATNVVIFATGDGGAGVAWLERGAGGRALVHAALAGGTRSADPPVPAVRVGRPLESALRYGRPLRLPVSCRAACDVRGQIAGAGADGQLSLDRAGHGVLRVYPEGRPFATRRGGLVHLRLFYGAPGAAHPALREATLRLRLRTPAPLPHPYDLRVVRRPGDRLRVTWSVATGDRRAIYFVYGVAKPGGRPLTLNAAGRTARRHFALDLRHVRGVRFVELHAYAADGRRARTLRVRLRRAGR